MPRSGAAVATPETGEAAGIVSGSVARADGLRHRIIIHGSPLPFLAAWERFVVSHLPVCCTPGNDCTSRCIGETCRIGLDTHPPIRRIPPQSSGYDCGPVPEFPHSPRSSANPAVESQAPARRTPRDPPPTRFVKEDPAHASPARRSLRCAVGHALFAS
jgi:hypothetical protein